jgi:hypothetical protein
VKFYLGTHMPNWLGLMDVPLFVSHRTLKRRHSLPKALCPWALDSGGFSELSMFGRWVTTEAEYVDAVYRYSTAIGSMDWAAPMDWMCEPFMLDKTGRTLVEHQARTVENLVSLRGMAPDLPFIPVLQGWALDDYLACIERYHAAGVDLTAEPVVGVGSVCRRQSTAEIGRIFGELAAAGLRAHGFGVKTEGLASYARHLASADSMAWSYNARRNPPLAGCVHKSCANCPKWAMQWRERVLRRCSVQQPELWEAPPLAWVGAA